MKRIKDFTNTTKGESKEAVVILYYNYIDSKHVLNNKTLPYFELQSKTRTTQS